MLRASVPARMTIRYPSPHAASSLAHSIAWLSLIGMQVVRYWYHQEL